jgi:hypothetical protein
LLTITATILTLTLLHALTAWARPPLTPAQLRAYVYRTDACLAQIVDHENGLWIATRYGIGGSYGLPQAQPGSKMRSAGPDWATNPWTQLRWARGYARGRYGSTCAAWAFWRAHRWW